MTDQARPAVRRGRYRLLVLIMLVVIAGATVGALDLAGVFTGPTTWTETTYDRSKTFADFVNAGDPQGQVLQPHQAVQVSCRVKGFAVADGDRWWYRLASSPWDGEYYATSDVFYNTPTPTGNPINGVVVDTRVPLC